MVYTVAYIRLQNKISFIQFESKIKYYGTKQRHMDETEKSSWPNYEHVLWQFIVSCGRKQHSYIKLYYSVIHSYGYSLPCNIFQTNIPALLSLIHAMQQCWH